VKQRAVCLGKTRENWVRGFPLCGGRAVVTAVEQKQERLERFGIADRFEASELSDFYR
jgi:hypothetical protein